MSITEGIRFRQQPFSVAKRRTRNTGNFRIEESGSTFEGYLNSLHSTDIYGSSLNSSEMSLNISVFHFNCFFFFRVSELLLEFRSSSPLGHLNFPWCFSNFPLMFWKLPRKILRISSWKKLSAFQSFLLSKSLKSILNFSMMLYELPIEFLRKCLGIYYRYFESCSSQCRRSFAGF